MKKIISSFCITYALILSLRIVVIPTPLNIYEQFVFIGMMIDYTLLTSEKNEN